ncbi:MAG: peptidase M14, partial [Mesorhizobium sp.]
MTLLMNRRFPRTLDTFPAGLGSVDEIEIWTFDDRAQRSAVRERLARLGIQARCRSAYKPLLHFFLEEIDLSDVEAVSIGYPVHHDALQDRFRLEAYPLAKLLDGVNLSFRPKKRSRQLYYDVEIVRRGGGRESHRVFAPNRLFNNCRGVACLAPTGWLIVDGKRPGRRIETDYEAIFHSILETMAQVEWPDRQPFFPELHIEVAISAADEKIGPLVEDISLAEAMHEDIYFSLLDLFRHRSGLAAADRKFRPGRIVPIVRSHPGAASATIEIKPIRRYSTRREASALHSLPHAPDLAQIRSELISIGGKALSAHSASGRKVSGRYISGSDLPIVITGGQHANETTGVVGALRAAAGLARRRTSHFAVVPLENPDGYALHQHLCKINPRHLNHAARFTALGDDLEHRVGGELWEKQLRLDAQLLSGADLHVNLHGYPAREWTRPLTGYIPDGYEKWTLPKGFFLIMRYHDGWEKRGRALLGEVTRHLSRLPRLLEFNAGQLETYRIHAGEPDFEMINSIPCTVLRDGNSSYPLTLITEYPDETIYGQEFIDGHTTQMEVVLAAYAAWQSVAGR